MNDYKTLHDDTHGEVPTEFNDKDTRTWPHENGKNNSRPPSRHHTGTEVAFYNVCYELPVKEKRKRKMKLLLSDVSGVMRPGVHAILGPTGSGKTTLLDILAGRKDKKYLKGVVLINGKKQPNKFKLISGYVVQDDVVMGTLTVRENLMFSASLRLPSEIGDNDRNQRVEMIINDLGLNKVSDSKVGNELIRGISGGERKRTSIGMELITSPDVIFLDEPTTGLDASTASSVMELLYKQGRRGRTVILSIHQPRYSIFKLFDTITLLSQGDMVYHGPRYDVLNYFENLGYICEEHDNPPDFLLDVIGCEEKSIKALKNVNEYQAIETEEAKRSYIEEAKGESLADKYKKTDLYASTQANVKSQLDNLIEHERNNGDEESVDLAYPTSPFTQFSVVSVRGIKNLLRNPKTGLSQISVNVMLAVVIGLIYLRIGKGESGLQNRIGVFFFLSMNMIFGNMNAVQIFIDDRRFFVHECASGYYRVSSYFFSKVICDILPMRIIPVTIFSAITYWMIGLESDLIKFLIYTLTLIITSMSSVAVCFVVSCSTKTNALASLFTVLPFIFMMIFSGMLINLKTLSKYVNWLKYLSIFRYSLQSLEINELHNMVFNCGNSTGPCFTGNQYLAQQGIKSRELWDDIMSLGVITLILLSLAYVQLRRIKKEK